MLYNYILYIYLHKKGEGYFVILTTLHLY